jgi:diguanylate cyclase (GGDEF)-like protein/PAS domain S-box-containing protein
VTLLVPFLFNVLYNFNIGPFGRIDLTPFAFTLAVVVLVWGIFRLRLLDLLPIARSRIVETMHDGVVVVDAYQRVVDLNPAAQRILGYGAGPAVGRPVQELMPDYAILLARSEGSTTAEAEIRLPLEDGIRDYEVTLSPIPDDRGRESGRLVVLRDITERKMTAERLERMTHYDALTGLPNRKLFSDRLSQSIMRARRTQDLVGLLFLDVDYFKDINDTLGHEVGDVLLSQLATRLQDCVRAEDTVARLSGDEFTVILSDIHTPTDAVILANRILEAVGRPMVVSGHELYVTASIGICVWPTDGEGPGRLLRNADVAMYRAKAQGRNRFEFYDTNLSTHAASRLQLEQDLRRALNRGEFQVHYQPIVSLQTGEVESFEALVRWDHPKRGLILPSEFLWRAKETGLIEAIGQWVLEESCRDVGAWDGDPARRPVSVAVNVSARQLKRPGFSSEVREVLERTGLESDRLVLEISEGTVKEDALTAAGVLRDLKGLGIELSLDDFGTGSTSLSQLRRFPLDTLKIDRLFVQGLGRDPEDAVIVQAMMSLATPLVSQSWPRVWRWTPRDRSSRS